MSALVGMPIELVTDVSGPTIQVLPELELLTLEVGTSRLCRYFSN